MKKPKLRVDKLLDPMTCEALGYAVLVEDGRTKIGPNPLTKCGAQCVKRIFERLDLDLRVPQPATAAKHNGKATGGCPKLQAWMMNRI